MQGQQLTHQFDMHLTHTHTHARTHTHTHTHTYLYESWKGGSGWLVDDEEGELVVTDQSRRPRAGAKAAATLSICVGHCRTQSHENVGRLTATDRHTHLVRQVGGGRSIGIQCTIYVPVGRALTP